jgi:hypothetical protein
MSLQSGDKSQHNSAIPAPDVNMPSWITDTLHAASRDTRVQPWKSTFGSEVDCRFDAGEDLVRVERNIGADPDPSCPFNTQGSSLAA